MSEGGRWATYTRLSIEKDDGGSHSVQLRDCRRYVSNAGGVIVLDESDDESGLVTTRPGYQRLVAAARRREFDGVVVWRYDRLGRDTAESFARAKELRDLGVRVVSATEGEDELTRGIMFVLAEEESRRISVRVHPRQLEIARSRGLLPRPPWGYRLEIDPASPDPLRPRRHLVVHESEAALYREMCRQFLAGMSYQGIGRWLAGLGHPAYWTTVRWRLENPIYAGALAFNRRRNSRFRGRGRNPPADHILTPDAAPAIIDVETRRLVLAELARRHRDHGRSAHPPWPLTGILYCACGRRMYGSPTGGRGGERPNWIYRCTTKLGPDPCPYPQAPGPRVEWALAEVLVAPPPAAEMDAAIARAARAAATDSGEGARRRASALARSETLKRRASALIDRLLDGTLTTEVYREKAAEIEAERAAIAVPEVEAAPPARDLAALRRMVEARLPLSELMVVDRRRLFRAMVSRAEWGGATIAAEWAPGYAALRGEAGRTIPLPKKRKAGGYTAWLRA